MNTVLSEQELQRRDALAKLEALGIDPYPAEAFEINATANDILTNYERDKLNYKTISIAGRMMSRRVMGNASFIELQDATGRIQAYLKRDDLCPGEDKTLYNTVFKKLLDIGDFLGIKGFVFTTNSGEISIHVQELTLLAKSLKPLPVVKSADGKTFDAVTDPEFRYRQRYVDLVVNPQVRETFVKVSKVKTAIRDFLNERGALEVDTPVLQSIPGGAAARPFTTHHNALDIPLYLRIANELYLKRLIVGGYDWVYEFSRNFRNEGMDRTHNPEFTVLEFYVAYKDYQWMMDITEKLFERVAIATNGATSLQVGDKAINFAAPYPRVSIYDAIKEHTGFTVDGLDEAGLRNVCKQLGIPTDESMGKGKLIDEIFGEKCEHHYIQPTFIIDYPVEMSPLTKKHRSKPGLVERFELMINGKELANAYSELNDPIDQRARFEEQLQLMERGDDEAMFIDHDFLRALEYGMPPTAGIGIGIDRLAMLMTNQQSIQDVLFFPQMRPEKVVKQASVADYQAQGVPEEWVPVLQKMGLTTMETLKAANPNKVFNDLGGLRKKMKLEIPMPTKDEVLKWFE
ncbi:lysine--tRNA ligase [Parapedobacter indicus]|uniref:Lysine--tRNA ligase n=1 Tax=Parapedobacter indicus TaxID=1477437 RepID=A0A1I3RR67_9SPHI|nr:lysine--tRNA ligase [Parapedobacter indicus]PPL00012.1 lysyl-tRNA synthetase class II [Parapedobacter indicus]SFJ49033.1 lysyl-tRNA synthetase, class II [Parapedobacter indicus]